MISGAGLSRIAAGVRPHGGAIVLMYHSVSPPDSPWIDPRFAVAPAVFEAQIDYLVRHCNVVSLDELVMRNAAGQSFDERSRPGFATR